MNDNQDNQTKKNWLVYMLRCADDSLYTGITNDLEKRLETHNAGKGARYTRARLPVKVVYQELVENRSSASIREYQLKQLSRSEKQRLLQKFSGSSLTTKQ